MLDISEILNARILIVDAQEANINLLEHMLRKAGYQQVTSTLDPSMICPMHSTHQYDLILLDLQIPKLMEFNVIAGLKQIESGGYLSILVTTAQPGHTLNALQSGAKDFVSKPFDLIEVQTRVHNMLEARMLYKKLQNYSKQLEQTVQERTAELQQSVARFKSFTELSTDWYWEQDQYGKFTKISGPVFEMLGIEVDDISSMPDTNPCGCGDSVERAQLCADIAARRPFLDFIFTRTHANGMKQYLQVSGEPIFDSSSRFIGYRGVGTDVSERMLRKPD